MVLSRHGCAFSVQSVCEWGGSGKVRCLMVSSNRTFLSLPHSRPNPSGYETRRRQRVGCPRGGRLRQRNRMRSHLTEILIETREQISVRRTTRGHRRVCGACGRFTIPLSRSDLSALAGFAIGTIDSMLANGVLHPVRPRSAKELVCLASVFRQVPEYAQVVNRGRSTGERKGHPRTADLTEGAKGRN